jgi:hypothetical protein
LGLVLLCHLSSVSEACRANLERASASD